MKSWTALVLLAALAAPASAGKLVESPVTKVINLLRELRGEVEGDGKREQKSYDKFACWCEETMQRKAADIASAKDYLEETQTLMTKLKGENGAHGAEIDQLKKDIASNLEAQKEATEVRDQENAGYEGEKTEYEQSIGALEGAIKVLTGAGAGKGGFLETMQQAKLISAAADLRRVMGSSAVARWASGKDLSALQRFVERPEDFATLHSRGVAALQTGQNPFGDYAPQSTVIQGLLKGMYDAFTADLEKSNVAEAEQQKSFEELIATKQSELETLQATLLKQESDDAAKKKLYADSKTGRDNTAAQLKADEAFFADTKDSCKIKATEWAERSRLRTAELSSFDEAIAILTSPEARATFASADTTLLQVMQKESEGVEVQARRLSVYAKLRELSFKQGHDLSLAKLAVAVKSGGHFDEVIKTIDQMVELVRKEEQDDIAHRDRCENSESQNKANIEDLEHTLAKTTAELGRIADRIKQAKKLIKQLESDGAATQEDIDARLEIRNKERANFEQALKDDSAAIGLLQAASMALQSFYKAHQIPLGFAQTRQEPVYTVDKDKAPETQWEGGHYGGRSEEHGNIVSIIEMIVEDLEKEIKTSRQEEAEAQQQYETDVATMRAAIRAAADSKAAAEKDLADLQAKSVSKESFHQEKTDDLAAERETEATLARDCAWVKTHFASRRDSRKQELEGLAEAKSILAGVDAGNFDELALSEGA